MAYCTDAELKAYFAAVLRLKNSSTDVASAVTATFVTQANTFAYNKIREKLRARGYALTDIDAWDRRQEFNLKLGCYELLISAANLETDDLWPEKYNIADELDEVELTIDAEIVDPEEAGAGLSSSRLTCYSQTDGLDDALEDDLP